MKYLDIDNILAEEERLPCTFSVTANNLGFLDPSSNNTSLASNTTVELPLWLVQELYKEGIVQIQTPKHFGQKMRDELDTNNTNVNLAGYSHYYFDVGLILSNATRDADLLRTLRAAFCGNRYLSLMVHGLSNYQDDVAEYSQTLTSTELGIYNEGLSAHRDLARWRSRKASLLEPSKLSKNLSKR